MASRRTRIKGIANIPQRRKTGGNSIPDEHVKSVPEIAGNQEEENHNLTSAQEDVNPHIDKGESPKEETAERQAEVEDTSLRELTSPDIHNGISSQEELKSVEKVEQKQPVLIPPRRRFIKPTVSLSAISRKSKDGSEDNKPVQLVISAPEPPKLNNNKIVILNEVITYPNQEEPIIIHSNHKQKLDLEDIKPEVDLQNVENLNFNNQSQNSNHKPLPLDEEIRQLPSNGVTVINSEIEYPVPPASPTKINRSRIKAVPRLGQRYHSFSASESEDESRRNYRHRNDSVCSTTSGIPDNTSISECPSPQKPKEFNSVIQRKCRRTEQSRKLAEARRDFYLKFGNNKPDRHKLTMIDLIFYNPTTNPMTHDAKNKKEVPVEDLKKDEAKPDENEDDPNKCGSDEENEMPAPQIKIGPQGEIVLDEQSLVIESKAVKKGREELQKSEVINGDFDTGYGIYKRAKRSKDWSKEETLKFYKALNTIGTDFTLMCELFPRRSRRELKMKFKKEERVNKNLVDKAIMQPCGFDFDDFKHEVDMEEKELQELQKQKDREQEMKKEAAKKRKSSITLKQEVPQKISKTTEKPAQKSKRVKKFDIMNVLDDDESDADESEIDDDYEEDKVMQNLQKPTRSGRIPKILDRYKAPGRNYHINNNQQSSVMKNEPGSLMVVASTGSNGEPVYKVFMVTGEQSRQQIGDDVNSLSKAMELRGIQNIFTLSTTNQEEEEETPPPEEENNVTIPAEEYNVTIPADEDNVNVNEEENNRTIPAEDQNFSTNAEDSQVAC